MTQSPPKKSLAGKVLEALDKAVRSIPFPGDRRPNAEGYPTPRPRLETLLNDPEWVDARTPLERRKEMLRHVDEADLATPAAVDHVAFMTRLAAEVGRGSVLTPDEAEQLKHLVGTWDRIHSTISQLAATRGTPAGRRAAVDKAVARLRGVEGLERLVEADYVRTKAELQELASRKIGMAKDAARRLGPEVSDLVWSLTARLVPLITKLRLKAELESSKRLKLWGLLRHDDDIVRGLRHFEVYFVSQLPRRGAPLPLNPRQVPLLAWASKSIPVENVTLELDPVVEKLPAPAGTEGGAQ